MKSKAWLECFILIWSSSLISRSSICDIAIGVVVAFLLKVGSKFISKEKLSLLQLFNAHLKVLEEHNLEEYQ